MTQLQLFYNISYSSLFLHKIQSKDCTDHHQFKFTKKNHQKVTKMSQKKQQLCNQVHQKHVNTKINNASLASKEFFPIS